MAFLQSSLEFAICKHIEQLRQFICIVNANLVYFIALFIYLLFAGPNIYSQSLAVLSGDLRVPFNITTTGHQLFLRWSSDHGTNKKGFRITYVGEYQSMYPRLVIPFSSMCVSRNLLSVLPMTCVQVCVPSVHVFVSKCLCICM